MQKDKGQFSLLQCGMPGVEATSAATERVLSRHMHDQFGIGAMVAGAHRSSSSHGAVEAFAGDTITVSPGEIHDGAPVGGSARAWKMLYIEPHVVCEAVGQITEGGPGAIEFFAPVLRRPGMSRDVLELFSILTSKELAHASLRAEELLLSVLASSLRFGSPSAAGHGVPQAIRHAQCLIDDAPSLPHSLDDLARASGLSRFQVVRGFSKATGLTPHAYLLQRRTQLARRLIRQGVPLIQAALDSGFADQSHMTRIFVRQFGMAPARYAMLGR